MDIRSAIKGQYRASFAMLREAIVLCPEAIWVSGLHPRTFWRIAYHAIFYGHLYMVQNESAFQPWAKHIDSIKVLWNEPPDLEPYSVTDMLGYLDQVVDMIDSTIDGLDLETSDSGYSWYPTMGKLEHELLNIRHLQGHVGQLSELLMAEGVDIRWAGSR